MSEANETTALSVYQVNEGELEQMAKDGQSLVINELTYVEADEFRLKLRRKRLSITDVFKKNKAILDTLYDRNKGEHERLLAIIKPVEDKIAAEVDKIKKAAEQEKRRIEEAERNRVEGHRKNIMGLAQRLSKVNSETNIDNLKSMFRQMEDFNSTYNAQEFQEEWNGAFAGLKAVVEARISVLESELEKAKQKQVQTAEEAQVPEPTGVAQSETKPEPIIQEHADVEGSLFTGDEESGPTNSVENEVEKLKEEASHGVHSISVAVNLRVAGYKFHVDPTLDTELQAKICAFITNEIQNQEF